MLPVVAIVTPGPSNAVDWIHPDKDIENTIKKINF